MLSIKLEIWLGSFFCNLANRQTIQFKHNLLGRGNKTEHYSTTLLSFNLVPILNEGQIPSAAEMNNGGIYNTLYFFHLFFPSPPSLLYLHSHDDVRERHGYLRSTSQQAQSRNLIMCGSGVSAFVYLHVCTHACVSK